MEVGVDQEISMIGTRTTTKSIAIKTEVIMIIISTEVN